MSSPIINEFLIDDENVGKFAEHGLSDRQVLQVLENYFLIAPNRKSRRAPYLVIGRDNGGACIATPVESTRKTDAWRPVTAWPCKVAEENRLNRG